MKKITIVLFFIEIFLVSCSHQPEPLQEPTTMFEGLKENRMRISSFNDFQLNTPIQIIVMDSLLIIHD